MRIWLVVILGAILSGISYAAYEIELRAMGADRIAALPLATSDKDTSAQSRESILGKTDETAGAIEPEAFDGIDTAPGEESPERVAAADPAVGDTVPLPAETAEVKPTFDVVSIDPDGTAVVAGRAAPGASVTLQIGDKAIGSALASDRGEWVIIPDELIPGGAQSLSLAATPESGGEPVQSDQVATIVLPDNAGDTAPSKVAAGAPRTSSAAGQSEQVASADSVAPGVSIPEQEDSSPTTIVADAEPAPVNVPVATSDAEPAPVEVPAVAPDAAVQSTSTPAAVEASPPTALADTIPAPAELPRGASDTVAQSGAIPAPSVASPPAIVAETAPAPIEGPTAPREAAEVSEAAPAAVKQIPPAVVAEAAGEPEVAAPRVAVVAEEAPTAPTPTAPTATTPAEQASPSPPQAVDRQELASLPSDRAPIEPTPADSPDNTSGPDAARAVRTLAGQSAGSADTVPSRAEGATTSNTPGAMVVLSQPGEPSRLLQSAEEPQAELPPITFDSVDYDDAGRVIVAGQVEAGADVRAYINNEILGDARADQQGRWTLHATRHIEPGAYELRVDRIDQAGLVIARASAPFRPVAPDIVARARERGEVVIQPGDNLWNIARDIYGQGTFFTVIYNANTNQIIDPDLIFPGQLLVTPGSSGLDRESVATGQSG